MVQIQLIICLGEYESLEASVRTQATSGKVKHASLISKTELLTLKIKSEKKNYPSPVKHHISREKKK